MEEKSHAGSAAAAHPETEEGVNVQVDQLKRLLENDPSLTPEQREAELKKARIALMRKLRVCLATDRFSVAVALAFFSSLLTACLPQSPTTPFNSENDMSKQAKEVSGVAYGQKSFFSVFLTRWCSVSPGQGEERTVV